MTLTLSNLDVRMGERAILTDISLSFTSGRLIGVLGPNGAGKSTLLRAILGLVPKTSGQIFFQGQNLRSHPPAKRAKILAYLPQSQSAHWGMAAWQVAALGRLPQTHGHSRLSAADEAIIHHAMAQTNCLQLRDRPIDRLSGGERARVLLARALAVEAPVLLADEPLAALDPGHQMDVMALLQQQARTGTLVLAVLHDLAMASRYCDELVILAEGRCLAFGPPAEVLTTELLERVYGIRARAIANDEQTIFLPVARCG